MVVVRVEERGGAEKRKICEDDVQTISDLKRKLCSADPGSIMLSFKGKILNDSTPISTLGDSVTFVIEKDIEFNKIASSDKCMSPDSIPSMYASRANGKTVLLGEGEVFFKQGRPYLVTRKTRKVKLQDIARYLRDNISRAHMIHAFLLLFIVVSGNYPLMAIVLTINVLRLVSYFALRYKLWEKTTGHFTYSLFMFLASLLAIDHEKFNRKRMCCQ